MKSRKAIYDWLDAILITDPVPEILEGAILYRSGRGKIDEAKKIIRVDCYSGMWTLTDEEAREERDVDFVIQCIVSPEPSNDENSEDERLDEAKDTSFAMAREIFRLMAPSGIPGACSAYGQEWETGEPSFGAANRGATYFYGKVNNET